MRFHLGPPEGLPVAPHDVAGWNPVWSPPDPERFHNLIVLTMVAVQCLALLAIASFWPGPGPGRLTWVVLLLLALLMPAHEALHCAGHPSFGFSDRTWVGIAPKQLRVYAAYVGQLPRWRRGLITLLPLIGLTGVPLFLVTVVRVPSVDLVFFAVANLGMSAADVVSATIIAWDVPPGATILQDATGVWWRRNDAG